MRRLAAILLFASALLADAPAPPDTLSDRVKEYRAAAAAHVEASATMRAANDRVMSAASALADAAEAVPAPPPTTPTLVVPTPTPPANPPVAARSFGINVLDFGVVGDGVTDDGPAIQACIDANPSRRLLFPRTAKAPGAASYSSSRTLVVTSPGQALVGESNGYQDGTIVRFAKGVTGIDLRHTATRAAIADLVLRGQEAYQQVYPSEGVLPAGFTGSPLADKTAPTTDGVRVGANLVRLTNVSAIAFGRHGFNFSNADCDGGAGLSDDCTIVDCYATNCRGYGFFTQGGDANASVFTHCQASTNALGGIYENSFLGNTYYSPKTDECHVDNASIQVVYARPTQALAGIARASGVVTLTFTAPYDGADPAGSGLVPGHGITVDVPSDPGFNGTFVVATVAGAVVTYAQPGADASPSAAGATGRRARMVDSWAAAGIPPTSGGYRVSNSTANRSVWIQPYSEGGQSPLGTGPCACLGTGSTVVGGNLPTDYARGTPFTLGLVSGIGQQGFMGGFPSVGIPADGAATHREQVGLTTDQDSIRYRQTFDGSAYLWTHKEGPESIRLYRSDPASDPGAVLIQNIDRPTGHVTFGRAVATGSGPTADRPALQPYQAGMQWFDTTLRKPIWWDGGVWRDAAGNAV